MIAANDSLPLGLRDALALSLVLVKPRLPDRRYWHLHQKCAAGTIAQDERAELDLLQAEKERAWSDERGGL